MSPLNASPALLKRFVQRVVGVFGYQLVNSLTRRFDEEDEFIQLYRTCQPFTMTSIERMYALYLALYYIEEAGIPGDIVECGVWRGGSCMLAALVLKSIGCTQRKIYLYDTFEGMTEPTDHDVSLEGIAARILWRESVRGHRSSTWCHASIEEVRHNMESTGYPPENLIFVKGRVEETLARVMPHEIALLRLDTDWHESTYHELRVLYPLLSSLGVLILDDYGHWRGCREASDRYFRESGITILLNRTDYSGRIGIKTQAQRS